MPILQPIAKLARLFGYLLAAAGLLLLLNLFGLPLRQEVSYQVSKVIAEPRQPLIPPDPTFSIVVNKIGAASRVIERVDPYDSSLYQAALARGVAHAAGTSLPGQGGNIFLFAHSSADLTSATRFNSVFYLMHHLIPGDEITVWYQGSPYRYQLTKKEIVPPEAVSYLSQKTGRELLTLMTCWPPGTTLNRLILTAEHLP